MVTLNLTSRGPSIVSIFQYISNKMQRYTVYLSLVTALPVSGGISAHHQELELRSNSSAIAAGSSYDLTSTRHCRCSCVCS